MPKVEAIINGIRFATQNSPRNVLRCCLRSLRCSSQTPTASWRPSEREARNKVTMSSLKYPLNKKILHYKALQMLRPKEPNEFIKPLLEIMPNDLMGNLKAVKINPLRKLFCIFAKASYKLKTSIEPQPSKSTSLTCQK